MNNILSGKRFVIYTLGCKVNQYESGVMAEMLTDAGLIRCGQPGDASVADICIINTCSVTNIADRKSRQMIRRLRKQNPGSVVAATGCYVQAAGDELLKSGICDVIIGNNRKKDVVRILEEYISGQEIKDNFIDVNKDPEFENLVLTMPQSMTRGYIKIQDGCNYFCTYCIIPYVRGRTKDKPARDVIEEARTISAKGVKEIVLTGICLSAYQSQGMDLGDVALRIAALQGIERVRISSLEPRIVTDEFLEKISSEPKICPHFHLSLQSACDSTLRRMNRHYTIDEYSNIVDKLRKVYDRPAITTDVIVGFPGETEEDFNETVKNLTKLGLYEMHIFKYSRRKGTAADRMEGQISEAVKAERSDILLKLSADNKKAYEDSFKNEKVKVLVEEMVEKDGKAFLRGHTERYILVDIPLGTLDPKECTNTVMEYTLT